MEILIKREAIAEDQMGSQSKKIKISIPKKNKIAVIAFVFLTIISL